MAFTNRSIVSTCATIVVIAFSALAGFVTNVIEWGRDFVWKAVEAFKEPKLSRMERPAEAAQACAYQTRQAKRERPAIFSTWRMCPSC